MRAAQSYRQTGASAREPRWQVRRAPATQRCAGLADPDYFSTFVRWNMPLNSGGLLTDREADDVAAYVTAQCRPGKGGVGPDGEPCPLSADCVDGAQVTSRTTPARILSVQQEPDVPSCPAPDGDR